MICEACGRQIIGKGKKAKVQYNNRNGGTVHHYYYRQCDICKRCWILRLLSIFIGIIVGILYTFFFLNTMMKVDSGIVRVFFIFLLNPLFVSIFVGAMFRIITNCNVELDKDGYNKKR